MAVRCRVTFFDVEQEMRRSVEVQADSPLSLLREAQDRDEEARLEALLLEGLVTGGEDIPLTRDFWKELKAEALGIAKKHKGRKKGK